VTGTNGRNQPSWGPLGSTPAKVSRDFQMGGFHVGYLGEELQKGERGGSTNETTAILWSPNRELRGRQDTSASSGLCKEKRGGAQKNSVYAPR